MKGGILLLFTIIVTSCKPSSQYFSPPVFLGISHIDAYSVTLDFDQEVTLTNITLDPRLKLASISNHTIFLENMQPAQPYWLQANAKIDNRITQFILNFWGLPLQDPPKLLLNELSILHNKNYADAIELIATESGSLAGITVYIGTPSHYTHRYIFPDYQLRAGSIIVLHTQQESQFAFSQKPGLGNTREIITIAKNPYTIPYQALAYEKSDASTVTASAQKRRFDANLSYLYAHDLWQGSPVDSTFASPTRTLNRRPKVNTQPEDATFWYITPNRGTSIGKANTLEEYQRAK